MVTATRLPILGAVLLAVLALVAGLTRPGTPPPAAASTPATTGAVVRSTLFCPDLRTIPGTLGTEVVVGTATPADGAVTLAAATSTTGAVPLLGANQQTATYTGPQTGPLVVRAQGALSAGVVGDQVARANKTSDRGWAEARCEPPRSDEWFIGAGTRPGDTAEVVLANSGDTRAIVTVTVLTPGGLVAASAGGNLVLAPHTVQRVPLTSLAPGAVATAVHVQTQVGELSAAVRDTRVYGTTLLGTDWVPLNEPAGSVVLPGLPGRVAGSAPRRVLYVADTSDEDTSVEVRVTTQAGTFVPNGLADKAVPAQSLISIDLSAVLGASPASVRVTSRADSTGYAAPVVAGAMIDAVSRLGNGIQEFAYVGAAAPIVGPALIPVIPLPENTECDLILSAPGDTRGVVEVSVSRGVGRPPLVTAIPVEAGETRVINLAGIGAVDNGSAVVTPEAGSGTVYASRLIQENGAFGPLLSEFTLTGPPTTEQVPATAQLPVGALS